MASVFHNGEQYNNLISSTLRELLKRRQSNALRRKRSVSQKESGSELQKNAETTPQRDNGATSG
jgi:hypothetical protein